MPSFLSRQSSYGRPAEAPLIRKDIELEGTNLAFQDILPKKAGYFADSLNGISSEFLSIDKPYYDQYKGEIDKKAQELKARVDKGENIKDLIPEMSAFKNQASSALNLFKQRKDLYSQWDQDLAKQVHEGKIDGNTADEYRQLAMANISGYTNKNGIGVDLPLPTAGPKVNYHEEAAKFVSAQVAREGDEWYEKAWNQLPVDETKYENTKRGYTLSAPEKIAYIVKKNLSQDPAVQKSLDHDSEYRIFHEINNAKSDEERAGIEQFAGEMHDFYKQGEIDDVANGLAWSMEGKLKSTDKRTISNLADEERAKKKIEQEGLPVIMNESVLVPGQPLDYKSLSDKRLTLEVGLNALPKEGSANDNYQTKAERDELTKRLAIINNTLNSGTTKYIATKEGKETVDNIYNNYLKNKTGMSTAELTAENNRTSPKGGIRGIDSKTYETIKTYIPDEKTFNQFMSGKLSLPEEVLNLVIGENVGGFTEGRTPITLGSLKNNESLQENVSKYIEKNPISYAANVLTPTSDKDPKQLLSNALTERVKTQGTNYTTPDGVQLNVFMANALGEGDKIRVSPMDDAIGGQYAHYLTITDKNGVVKTEMPIYPKTGAKEEMGYMGRQMMDSSPDKKDPLQASNYKTGEKMLANSYFSDGINSEYIESYANLVENNGNAQVVKNVSINLPTGPIPITVDVFKKDGVTYYAPKYSDGSYVKATTGKVEKEDKAYKSLDDMKVDLLRGFQLYNKK